MGNDRAAPEALRSFEAWLGCRVDGVSVHTGQASWPDWAGSIGYVMALWSGSGRRLYWSVPLIPEGANLEDGARGAYDGRYVSAAKAILAGSPGNGAIEIRTGWEFNQNHMPWSSSGLEAEFGGTFRHFVKAFRRVSGRFRFEWAPAIGGRVDPARSYPGDAYVDIVGIDAYYNVRWDSPDAAMAWANNVRRPYGFDWLERFAATHRKPTAYGEWGVMSPRAAPYVRQAALWYASHPVVYQSYWNSDSSFPGRLTSARLAGPAAAYRQAFGQCPLVS
ncbi:glycosyl hydrolase [Sphingomonas oryzagri]